MCNLQNFLSPYPQKSWPPIPEFRFHVSKLPGGPNKFQLRLRAVEEKDSEFEIDRDKAREALRKLDQQLQSISEKKISSPKIRASDVNLTATRDQVMEEEVPDYTTGPTLPYLASGLIIFTILYNILFVTVIQPSIDGVEAPTPTSSSVREE